MKIESVRANNRKKAFEIETRTGTYTFPYALLRLQPDPKNRITEAFPDEDLGKEGFTYRLAKGGEDTVHIDAVLEYNQDPGYLNDLLLHRLTLEAQKAVESSDLSKRELIRPPWNLCEPVLPPSGFDVFQEVCGSDAGLAPPSWA